MEDLYQQIESTVNKIAEKRGWPKKLFIKDKVPFFKDLIQQLTPTPIGCSGCNYDSALERFEDMVKHLYTHKATSIGDSPFLQNEFNNVTQARGLIDAKVNESQQKSCILTHFAKWWKSDENVASAFLQMVGYTLPENTNDSVKECVENLLNIARNLSPTIKSATHTVHHSQLNHKVIKDMTWAMRKTAPLFKLPFMALKKELERQAYKETFLTKKFEQTKARLTSKRAPKQVNMGRIWVTVALVVGIPNVGLLYQALGKGVTELISFFSTGPGYQFLSTLSLPNFSVLWEGIAYLGIGPWGWAAIAGLALGGYLWRRDTNTQNQDKKDDQARLTEEQKEVDQLKSTSKSKEKCIPIFAPTLERVYDSTLRKMHCYTLTYEPNDTLQKFVTTKTHQRFLTTCHIAAWGDTLIPFRSHADDEQAVYTTETRSQSKLSQFITHFLRMCLEVSCAHVVETYLQSVWSNRIVLHCNAENPKLACKVMLTHREYAWCSNIHGLALSVLKSNFQHDVRTWGEWVTEFYTTGVQTLTDELYEYQLIQIPSAMQVDTWIAPSFTLEPEAQLDHIMFAILNLQAKKVGTLVEVREDIQSKFEHVKLNEMETTRWIQNAKLTHNATKHTVQLELKWDWPGKEDIFWFLEDREYDAEVYTLRQECKLKLQAQLRDKTQCWSTEVRRVQEAEGVFEGTYEGETKEGDFKTKDAHGHGKWDKQWKGKGTYIDETGKFEGELDTFTRTKGVWVSTDEKEVYDVYDGTWENNQRINHDIFGILPEIDYVLTQDTHTEGEDKGIKEKKEGDYTLTFFFREDGTGVRVKKQGKNIVNVFYGSWDSEFNLNEGCVWDLTTSLSCLNGEFRKNVSGTNLSDGIIYTTNNTTGYTGSHSSHIEFVPGETETNESCTNAGSFGRCIDFNQSTSFKYWKNRELSDKDQERVANMMFIVHGTKPDPSWTPFLKTYVYKYVNDKLKARFPDNFKNL